MTYYLGVEGFEQSCKAAGSEESFKFAAGTGDPHELGDGQCQSWREDHGLDQADESRAKACS